MRTNDDAGLFRKEQKQLLAHSSSSYSIRKARFDNDSNTGCKTGKKGINNTLVQNEEQRIHFDKNPYQDHRLPENAIKTQTDENQAGIKQSKAEDSSKSKTSKSEKTVMGAAAKMFHSRQKDKPGFSVDPDRITNAVNPWSNVDENVVGLKHFEQDKKRSEERDVVPRVNKGPHSLISKSLKTVVQDKGHNDVVAADAYPLSSESPSHGRDVEDIEKEARQKATTNPFKLLYLGNLSALKVIVMYLITRESLISVALTVGMTIYWYEYGKNNAGFKGSNMDFLLLSFGITRPIATVISLAYTRRERALIAIADFRSFSHHIFLAHCLWEWTDNEGSKNAVSKDNIDWLEHCDAVMAQLIGIGDELSRFLTLPCSSRSRHKFTREGRKEAARLLEVSSYLLDSMSSQRITRLMYYSERLKKMGVNSGEMSRLRQYERFLSAQIEQLRMVKMYRTPSTLQSFSRLFTVLLPPFYAPTYAQVAKDSGSLGVGISFGIIAALGLTALFETWDVLEDPFVTVLALDGIDVREELEILHFTHLASTRKLAFPNAPEYRVGRRRALIGELTNVGDKPFSVENISSQPRNKHHFHHGKRKPVSSVSDLSEPEDKKGYAIPGSETGRIDEENENEGSDYVFDYDDVERGVQMINKNKSSKSNIVSLQFLNFLPPIQFGAVPPNISTSGVHGGLGPF